MILAARVGASSHLQACPIGTFGQLPRPVLTNPNPLHHPRVLPAQNGQCRIHARLERTRPLTGAGIEAVRRPRERRPRRFPVHAAAPRSKVTIAGYNMHVKSSWESVLQLAVLPQLVNLPVVLVVLHGAIHRQAGGKVIVYSVCGEWLLPLEHCVGFPQRGEDDAAK